MARPTLTQITHGAQGWDAVVDDNFSKLVDAPFPICVSTGTGISGIESQFPAANYEDCLVVDATSDLYISNGTAWKRVDATT